MTWLEPYLYRKSVTIDSGLSGDLLPIPVKLNIRDVNDIKFADADANILPTDLIQLAGGNVHAYVRADLPTTNLFYCYYNDTV